MEFICTVWQTINCWRSALSPSLLSKIFLPSLRFLVRHLRRFLCSPLFLRRQWNVQRGDWQWREDYRFQENRCWRPPSRSWEQRYRTITSIRFLTSKGATFQVASNFNCLEFMSSKGSAKQGITKYVYDMTQGPAASISAAPGTLYRNYFVRHTPEDSPNSVYIGMQISQLR